VSGGVAEHGAEAHDEHGDEDHDHAHEDEGAEG
jgi:hypothetical protein